MPSPHAHGYLVIKKPPATDVTGLYPFPWAAGAIISNAADTATFYRALLSGRLLQPGLLHAMETTHAQKHVDIPGQRYGLGLIRYSTACGTAWGHNGSYPGYYVYDLTSSDGQRQAVIEVNARSRQHPEVHGPAVDSPARKGLLRGCVGTRECLKGAVA